VDAVAVVARRATSVDMDADSERGGSWLPRRWRRAGAAEPGLDPGLVRAGSGFFLFFCFLFDLPWWAWNQLGNCHIYCDLSAEAVAKTALVNRFCPPR
jgi:hypothetical protein